MKSRYSTLALIVLIAFTGINSMNITKNNNNKALVKVYYFHFERRCATCIAVEEESLKALNLLYPTQMKKGEIAFQSVNLEDKQGEDLANQLKIAGQSLVIVKGAKVIDITEQGFLYAKSNPEKLKAEIKKQLDLLLK